MPTRDHLSPVDHTLIALADPTRRAILARLVQGEARVTDVAAGFDISLNSVSKHIRTLERAKLVLRRQSGREHFLRYNPVPLEAASQWLKHQQQLWSAQLEALDEFLQREDEEHHTPKGEDS